MSGVLLVAFIYKSLLYNVVDRITNDSVVFFMHRNINLKSHSEHKKKSEWRKTNSENYKWFLLKLNTRPYQICGVYTRSVGTRDLLQTSCDYFKSEIVTCSNVIMDVDRYICEWVRWSDRYVVWMVFFFLVLLN